MADLAITPALVVAGRRIKAIWGVAGVALSAGKAVYRDPADKRFKLAQTTSSSATVRKIFGIALNSAAAGQPVKVLWRGPLTSIGATVEPGQIYLLSSTAGGIAPLSDLRNTWRPAVIGIGGEGQAMSVGIVAPDVELTTLDLQQVLEEAGSGIEAEEGSAIVWQ